MRLARIGPYISPVLTYELGVLWHMLVVAAVKGNQFIRTFLSAWRLYMNFDDIAAGSSLHSSKESSEYDEREHSHRENIAGTTPKNTNMEGGLQTVIMRSVTKKT